MGATGEPSQPKCDRTRPPIIWPDSRYSVIGPAPICGLSHAIANTSDAPMAPAVNKIGFTCFNPASAPACHPLRPMTIAHTAPIHQKSAFPTLGFPSTAPTFPFIDRCTVSTIPRNIVKRYRYAFISAPCQCERDCSVREIDAFVELVVVEAGRRREEADDFHLFSSGVVEHMHGASGKQHRRA